MTPQRFVAWRKRMRLTQSQVANHLGLTLKAVQNIESGETRRIKRSIRLAMTAISLNLPPYDDLPAQD